MGLTINRTMPYPAAAARIGPGCVSAHRCEIRALILHIYPDGIKAYGHERITQSIGRRCKPIKKMRYMPMALAHQLSTGPQAPWQPWHHGAGALRPRPRPAAVSWPADQRTLQAAC